jgi:dUTP pyrophosphatase
MAELLSIRYRLLPHAPEGQLEKKQTSDAGFDVRAAEDFIIRPVHDLPFTEETVLFHDGSEHPRRKYQRQLIPTGIQLAPEDLAFFLLLPRSGFSSDYLMLMRNTIGLIDFEYRGELLISVYALHHELPIARGERIAQLLPLRQSPVNLIQVDELSDSQRGTRGFGSSGH